MSSNQSYYFPFGQKVKKVQQSDTSPKEAFVLGVYASAVHAKWIGNDGKQKVTALAVASEPTIFWNGEDAEKIISKISIPAELGKLTIPSQKGLNGPSGRALDEKFLKPLNLHRTNPWLCDLLPESRVNPQQRNAINKFYTEEIRTKFNLPEANIPDFDKSILRSNQRVEEILEELENSRAHTLILLGDLPIQYFLKKLTDGKYSKLSQFGETDDKYGKINEIKINDKAYNVIALCHPRQADRLGSANAKWGNLHDSWLHDNLS